MVDEFYALKEKKEDKEMGNLLETLKEQGALDAEEQANLAGASWEGPSSPAHLTAAVFILCLA